MIRALLTVVLALACAVPASAVVQEVQYTSGQSTNGGTLNVTTTFVNAPANGDLLVAEINWNRAGTGCPSTGWTLLDSTSTASSNGFIYYKIADASGTKSFTFACTGATGGYPAADMVEFSGQASSPFDGHTIQVQASNPTLTTASLTPTLFNDFPVAWFDAGGGSAVTVTTPPVSVWTQLFTDGQGPVLIYDGTLTTDTTTAQQCSLTLSAATGSSAWNWIALIASASVPAPTNNAIGHGDFPGSAIGTGRYFPGAVGNGSGTSQ